MRKKWQKAVSLMMVGLMTVSLAACGSENDNDTTPTPPSSEDDKEVEGNNPAVDIADESGEPGEGFFTRAFDKYIQDEVPVDLNGYEFKVVDFNTHWGLETISNPQDQLIVDIIADVEETFNCKIVSEAVSPDVIFETVQPEVMGGGKYADLVGTTMWAFGKLLGGGVVRDLNDVETLDLSADYFNQNVVKVTTFGNSTYAFGAPFGSHFSNNWVIFYNARIWEELNLPDPYELVRNNEWTWDRFVEYAKLALRDMDSDGVVSSESDRWGLTAPSGDLIRAIFFATGARFYKDNGDGHVRLACLDPESADKINFIYKLFQSDNILYRNENLGYMETFAAGRSLFLSYGNTSNEILKDMEDDFGVLPMPKWNSEQEEYNNAVDHNAPIYAMTTTNKNTYEAGIIITALAKRFQAFDELTLQDREDTFWRFEEDREMVENYIVGHGAYDVINIIKNANTNFEVPSGALFSGAYNNAYTDIVSTIAAMEGPLNIMLDEFFDNLSK